MTDKTTHAHGFHAPPVGQAPYLDTQTLGGDDGYFHTENAPTHRTDGTAVNPDDDTGATPLVLASQSTASSGGQATNFTVSNTPRGDGLDEMKNADLRALADERGVDVPPRANKATLLAALRGE